MKKNTKTRLTVLEIRASRWREDASEILKNGWWGHESFIQLWELFSGKNIDDIETHRELKELIEIYFNYETWEEGYAHLNLRG